jgi:hypothetical protein
LAEISRNTEKMAIKIVALIVVFFAICLLFILRLDISCIPTISKKRIKPNAKLSYPSQIKKISRKQGDPSKLEEYCK